jgi:hypothetical protein
VIAPDACHILTAEVAAARSPCAKSKRGVALFDPDTGAHRGEGWNGLPGGALCPGLSVCGSNCNKLCVHAEVRALRMRDRYAANGHPSSGLHLLNVKLGADGHVTPGGPPSCWQCSREILDVGFVAGVWLFELGVPPDEMADAARRGIAVLMWPLWRYYTAEEFHRVTLRNAKVDQPPAVTDPAPIPMRLTCPACNALHVDEGEFAMKPHHTHACQGCGAVWRPAVVPTVGVRFLPGFRNEARS